MTKAAEISVAVTDRGYWCIFVTIDSPIGSENPLIDWRRVTVQRGNSRKFTTYTPKNDIADLMEALYPYVGKLNNGERVPTIIERGSLP